MDGIKIQVSGNAIQVPGCPAIITSGTIGLPVSFTFDDQWDGLTKLAVFQAGSEIRTVELAEDETVVPWEVLEKPNTWLRIGVYGINEDGTLAIPTLYAKVYRIQPGADPEADPAVDPTAPIWLTCLEEIEKLKQSGVGGGVTEEEFQAAVEGLQAGINEAKKMAQDAVDHVTQLPSAEYIEDEFERIEQLVLDTENNLKSYVDETILGGAW